MRALIVVTLLALTGCAALTDRSDKASTPSSAAVADRMGAQANAKKSGDPVKSGAALTSDPLARPGRI